MKNWAAHYRTLTTQELIARTIYLTISADRGQAIDVDERFAALEAEQDRRCADITVESNVWAHITVRWRGRGRVWYAADSSQFHSSNTAMFATACASVDIMNDNPELARVEFAIQPYDAARRIAPAAMRNLPGW